MLLKSRNCVGRQIKIAAESFPVSLTNSYTVVSHCECIVVFYYTPLFMQFYIICFQRMQNDLNMSVVLKELGDDPVYPGQGVQLPPVILASLGDDPTKKTVSNVTCIIKRRTSCAKEIENNG